MKSRDLSQRALDLFRSKRRPVLVGELACELNLSLAEAGDVVAALAREDKIRAITAEERRRWDLHRDAAAYVLDR